MHLPSPSARIEFEGFQIRMKLRVTDNIRFHAFVIMNVFSNRARFLSMHPWNENIALVSVVQ